MQEFRILLTAQRTSTPASRSSQCPAAFTAAVFIAEGLDPALADTRYGNQFIAAWFVPSTGEFERWKRRGDHSMTGLPVDSGELRARQGAGSTRPPLFTSLLEPVRGRRGIEGAGRTGRVAARDVRVTGSCFMFKLVVKTQPVHPLEDLVPLAVTDHRLAAAVAGRPVISFSAHEWSL